MGRHGASAILVFVPGLAEITDLHQAMKEHPVLQDGNKFWLMPLHSALATEEQKAVFNVPPAGVTKVVLSTNIAETSVTINDISCVVDCGTHKEMQYDPMCGMSCLREVRVSKVRDPSEIGHL
jgi:ATP-dependent RNA helicase DHX29